MQWVDISIRFGALPAGDGLVTHEIYKISLNMRDFGFGFNFYAISYFQFMIHNALLLFLYVLNSCLSSCWVLLACSDSCWVDSAQHAFSSSYKYNCCTHQCACLSVSAMEAPQSARNVCLPHLWSLRLVLQRSANFHFRLCVFMHTREHTRTLAHPFTLTRTLVPHSATI